MDVILFWSAVVSECNRIDHTTPTPPSTRVGLNNGPTRSSRATAIAHIAMHDAYFRIKGFGGLPAGTPKTFYLAPPPGWAGGNTDAEAASAVSGAAATALKSLYPHADFSTMIDAKINELAISNGSSAAAFQVGEAIANAVLALRAADQAGNLPDAGHSPSPSPYHHRPDPASPGQGYLGVGYGGTDPFVATGIAPLAPYPAPGTPVYAENLNEVVGKGKAPQLNGVTRTADETVIGLFWGYDGAQKLGTPPRLYNQVLAKITNTPAYSEAERARIFGLANAAMGDCGIYAWRDKYLYDLWRPVVGVREADVNSVGPSITDAQADTQINGPCDPFWLPLGRPATNKLGEYSRTPDFPAYPSGHATFGAAIFEILRLFQAEKAGAVYDPTAIDNIAFTFVSDELNGSSIDPDGSVRPRINRKYTSVAAAMYENSISRIFLGVHWRFDGTSGKTVKKMLEANDRIGGVPLGREIATEVFSGFHQP
jgi:membrane-associated phospholipid phosphatase